eukprot:3446299-Rhodomonas_salina.2
MPGRGAYVGLSAEDLHAAFMNSDISCTSLSTSSSGHTRVSANHVTKQSRKAINPGPDIIPSSKAVKGVFGQAPSGGGEEDRRGWRRSRGERACRGLVKVSRSGSGSPVRGARPLCLGASSCHPLPTTVRHPHLRWKPKCAETQAAGLHAGRWQDQEVGTATAHGAETRG